MVIGERRWTTPCRAASQAASVHSWLSGGATTEAVDGWVAEVIDKAAPRQAFLETCTPGHYNYEGQPGRKRFALLNELYGGGAVAYFAMLRQLRANAQVDGQYFAGEPASAAP